MKKFVLALLVVFALLSVSSAPAQAVHDFSKFEEEMGWMKVDACEMQSFCCHLCGLGGWDNSRIECRFYMGTDMDWHCKCEAVGPC